MAMNVSRSVNMYESVKEVVYPKYSVMILMVLNLSGFREHSDHL